jgi:putative endonuclease
MPKRSPQVGTNTAAWFVYLLRCRDGTLYTGITTDVKRRLLQHNQGTAARYTRSRLPTRLVYQEPHPNRSQALKREAALKRLSRRAKLALVRQARRTKA